MSPRRLPRWIQLRFKKLGFKPYPGPVKPHSQKLLDLLKKHGLEEEVPFLLSMQGKYTYTKRAPLPPVWVNPFVRYREIKKDPVLGVYSYFFLPYFFFFRQSYSFPSCMFKRVLGRQSWTGEVIEKVYHLGRQFWRANPTQVWNRAAAVGGHTVLFVTCLFVFVRMIPFYPDEPQPCDFDFWVVYGFLSRGVTTPGDLYYFVLGGFFLGWGNLLNYVLVLSRTGWTTWVTRGYHLCSTPVVWWVVCSFYYFVSGWWVFGWILWGVISDLARRGGEVYLYNRDDPF